MWRTNISTQIKLFVVNESDDDLLYLAEKENIRHQLVLHSLTVDEFNDAQNIAFAGDDARSTNHFADESKFV